ncbi:MAG: HAD family hydrolase [Planctomycetaceae bacterium]
MNNHQQVRLQAGTSIELAAPIPRNRDWRFALFDFDGTLSLIREGWFEIMSSMFIDELADCNTSETSEQLADVVRRFITDLTGKQTIYQMLQLAAEVRQRGGQPREALDYKHAYHQRLMSHVAGRRDGLRNGSIDPQDLLVPGSLEILDQLRQREITLYLASGTDLNYVLEETELLGLSHYFGTRIYGALDDYASFSKQQVITHLLQEHGIDGHQLLGFGDGYVEIENVKQAGGLAVAVATAEANLGGQVDPWKRQRLLDVGADIVIPDFHEAGPLCDIIWNAD